MRNRIYLETETDCMEFCNAACLVDGKVELVNASGRYRINAKSMLGCLMASAEWGDGIWLETDEELYGVFNKWIAETADDGASVHF